MAPCHLDKKTDFKVIFFTGRHLPKEEIWRQEVTMRWETIGASNFIIPKRFNERRGMGAVLRRAPNRADYRHEVRQSNHHHGSPVKHT